MTYQVVHTSAYRYGKPVSLCHNLVHLRPRDDAAQTCTHWKLEITPEPKLLTEQLDYFGNRAAYFTVEEAHDRLTVQASSQVEVSLITPPDAAASPPWERTREFLQGDRSPRGLDARQFVFDSPYIKAAPELVRYAAPSFTPGRPLLEAALDLMHRIYADFVYDPRPRPLPRRCAMYSNSGAASARTSPTWKSVACARLAWPPATSAAICARSRRPASRAWWAWMLHTPGCQSIVRTLAGSDSIRPTT